MTVRLTAGRLVAVRFESICAAPVTYTGSRDDLSVQAGPDDWLVVELSVSGALPGRGPEQGYQPPTHEESHSFRIDGAQLHWRDATSDAPVSGPCVWQ